MPGIAGFASHKPLSPKQLDARLEALENALTLTDKHRLHRVLFGPRVGCAVTNLLWQSSPIVQTPAGLTIWLDGACFNREDLARRSNRRFDTDAEFFLSAITNPLDRALLKSVDGLFAAVVFDAHRELLHIVTDRYGLRPLYWVRNKDHIAWASETKAFLTLPGFSPEISEDAREAFFVTGQLPPNQTWLTGVEQLPPATRITCRLSDGALTRERYWHWQELAPRMGSNNMQDLADELGKRFGEAVKRQCNAPRPGLVLSGGLDSRAILAAMPEDTHTFTFGQPNSPDVTIAAQVAAVKKSPHDIWPLNTQNWLAPRIAGTWWLDGALNLQHMHGIEHMHRLSDVISLCFNGAGGDGLVGGGHLFAPNDFNQYLHNQLQRTLNTHPTILNGLQETFNRTGSAHAFYIDWRMRGFTIHGPRLAQFSGLDYRLPFLDNAVQEFLYTIPLELKRNNRLYRKMLLSTFPRFFTTIPYQKTGRPITWPNWATKGLRVFNKLRHHKPNLDFANYANWLRQSPAKNLVETCLLSPQALHTHYQDPTPINTLWEAHLKGQNHADMMCRYLTFEIYLQQLFNQKYRTLPEAEAWISTC